MNILIPCYSNAPDREHDAVVIKVDDELLRQLARRRLVFDRAHEGEPDLYAHEYREGPVYTLTIDDGEYLDAPFGPVRLNTHLDELDLHGSWHLTDANAVYLKVVKEGFFYTWDGRRDKHGPSEEYETETFDLAQLQALYRTPAPHLS